MERSAFRSGPARAATAEGVGCLHTVRGRQLRSRQEPGAPADPFYLDGGQQSMR